MKALAKLWTWIGNTFIPIATAWTIYVRNGLTTQPPPCGVLISRGYWGVLVSLVTGAALIWTAALYVRIAKRENALILVPANTMFEDDTARCRPISWGTLLIFTVSVLAALAVFGSRYAESQIHRWGDQRSLERGFLESRARAYELGCARQPCFAVGQRVGADGNPIFGVNEYILYLTDGVLVLLLIVICSGAAFLVKVVLSRPQLPAFRPRDTPIKDDAPYRQAE
jgi:hypothetical protein